MNTTPAAVALRPPFRKEHQLNNEFDGVVAGTGSLVLPSQPRLSMASSKDLAEFLVADICPTKLNQLATHLWLCSASSYTTVPPLHNHAIHGRTILPTEDPALHSVWVWGRIFLKPLPAYLLSHTFWTQYLYHSSTHVTLKPVTQAALGLLRSYRLSIRHESVLRIAQQSHLNLVPHDITWKQRCDFSTSFDEIQKDEAAPRYHYGKLQLSRLHWLVRIFSRELYYCYIDGDYGESFERYAGPLLFVLGFCLCS
jgi:hypothetical protein